MDFVCKLYGNTYAVHVTVALVGVATLNLALPAPLKLLKFWECPLYETSEYVFKELQIVFKTSSVSNGNMEEQWIHIYNI